jgi:hypothetical protein
MTIKRYHPWCSEVPEFQHTLSEHPEGMFVLYEDYEKLRQELELIKLEREREFNEGHLFP